MTAQAQDKTLFTEAELTALGTRAFVGLGPARGGCRRRRAHPGAGGLVRPVHARPEPIESYGDRLQVQGINARARVATQTVAPALRLVDGDNGVGPLVGMHALRAAMEARRVAAAWAWRFARGSNHFGPISPYGLIAAQAGFASIIGSNATTTIAPGRQAMRGWATARWVSACPIPAAILSCWTWR